MEQNVRRVLWLLAVVSFVLLWILFNDPDYKDAAIKYLIFIGAVFLLIVFRRSIKLR